MEIPQAAIARIMKNAGASRVSEDAKRALSRFLENSGTQIALKAIKLAKYSGRKTVNAEDINLAFNIMFRTGINNIYNTREVLVNSNSVKMDLSKTINIKNSFKQLYKQSNYYNNSDEIKHHLTIIENGLHKDEINKSEINTSIDWLKRNAEWTMPSLVQIILAFLGFG